MRIKIFAKLNPLRRVVTISLLVLGVVSIVGTFKGFGAARTEEITSLIGTGLHVKSFAQNTIPAETNRFYL